jgi:hypothetical protein
MRMRMRMRMMTVSRRRCLSLPPCRQRLLEYHVLYAQFDAANGPKRCRTVGHTVGRCTTL